MRKLERIPTIISHLHLLEHRRIILIAPNQYLRNATQRLNEEASIVLRHRRVPVQNVVQILEVLQRQTVLRFAPAAAEPAATAEHDDEGPFLILTWWDFVFVLFR